MTYTVPTIEPEELRAGDSVTWRRSLSDYPASVWTLSYALRSITGKIDITAAADDDDHLVEETPATSAAWTPGRYGWAARVTDGTDVYTIATGDIVVLPDLSAEPGAYDSRSFARQQVDNLKVALNVLNSKIDASYEIAGRKLTRSDRTEVRKELQYWEAIARAEEQADKSSKGLASGRLIKTRFT